MEIKPIKTLERALSTEEVKRLATSCKRQAKSDEDLRRRLTEAGFHGDAAQITSYGFGPMYAAVVIVPAPNGELINA